MRTPRNITSPYTDATPFWNKFNSVNPRMALFMKVTPYLTTDVSTIGLTSNTRDMTLPGHACVFKSAAGMMPSSAQQSINDQTTLEMTGIYTDDLFKRTDVIGGKWENARIEIFVASWDDVNLGELVIFSGFLGEVKDFQTFFTAEGRGLTSKLSQDVSWVTQRFCRVKKFRDSQCGHTSNTVTIDGTAYNITYSNYRAEAYAEKQNFGLIMANSYFTNVPPDNYFNNGVVKGVTGANTGISREISQSLTMTISGTSYTVLWLKRPFPFDVKKFVLPSQMDRFDVSAGCNRTVEDCQKYSNIINFRGEPYVPGLTQMMRVPKDDEWEVEQY